METYKEIHHKFPENVDCKLYILTFIPLERIILTPPNCESAIHNEPEKNDSPSHNKLENSDSPQVIMIPPVSTANQWRVNINW